MGIVSDHLKELEASLSALAGDTHLLKSIEAASKAIKKSLKTGGKILIAGNGGSAAEAQHFSAELVGRFIRERKALPAVALSTDTSILTSLGNDFGYDRVFERQVQALGSSKDVLVTLSTSGNSKNLLLAAAAAKQKKMKIIALLGKGGGKAKKQADIAIVVPSNSTARIQEIHLLIIHSLCDSIDREYVKAR